MDFATIIILCIFIFLICSCGSACCRKKERGVVLSPPVTVTSVSHTAPGGYTVTQPMPPVQQPAYPPYGSMYPPPQANATGQMPMPMPMPTSAAPPRPGEFPPLPMQMPQPYNQMNPPPYDVAVGAPTANVPSTDALHNKQAPYNPYYNPQ